MLSPTELKVLRDCQNALSPFGGELLLFGSRARRDHRDGSDFDFWLRIPRELHGDARRALPKRDFSVGLLLLEPGEVLPLFDATLPDQIKVTELLALAEALGPDAVETPRKPPKPFTVEVSTPDTLLEALLDNFKLERVTLGFQIVEIDPGHPFGAYVAVVPDSSVTSLLQAGLLVERATSTGVQIELAPYAGIAWELAGVEGGAVVDPQVVTSAKQELCVNSVIEMRCTTTSLGIVDRHCAGCTDCHLKVV